MSIDSYLPSLNFGKNTVNTWHVAEVRFPTSKSQAEIIASELDCSKNFGKVTTQGEHGSTQKLVFFPSMNSSIMWFWNPKNGNSKFSVSNSSNSSCMSDQSCQFSLLSLPNPGLLEKTHDSVWRPCNYLLTGYLQGSVEFLPLLFPLAGINNMLFKAPRQFLFSLWMPKRFESHKS